MIFRRMLVKSNLVRDSLFAIHIDHFLALRWFLMLAIFLSIDVVFRL